MTPCMDAVMMGTRVLCIASLVVVLVALWERRRLEEFLLARASKPIPNPWKRFWTWAAVGAIIFSAESFFVERYTGVHFPLILHILTSLLVFALFVALMALAFFVMPRHHARNPRGALRLGLILIAVAGILSVVALYVDLRR